MAQQSSDVPEAVRQECYERDNWRCRFCGVASAYSYELHHINYRSGGGVHEAWNLILLCGDHHRLVHTDKALWQPWLYEALRYPGLTVLQVKRRADRRAERQRFRELRDASSASP